LLAELNRDLGLAYGLPVDFEKKIDGLKAIGRALNRGDIIHARIATLHLQIPDPPCVPDCAQTFGEIFALAYQLQVSGMLKTDWEPAKHPRWPAGKPGGIGGEFFPVDGATVSSTPEESSASVLPAQITIPVPFDLPGALPLPSEIVPPPLLPNINPRDIPRNPYPDRPECEVEWAEATNFCLKLAQNNQLGRGDYRGMGRTLSQCIVGQVSQDCGGNATGT